MPWVPKRDLKGAQASYSDSPKAAAKTAAPKKAAKKVVKKAAKK
jgi:hypothetical protein